MPRHLCCRLTGSRLIPVFRSVSSYPKRAHWGRLSPIRWSLPGGKCPLFSTFREAVGQLSGYGYFRRIMRSRQSPETTAPLQSCRPLCLRLCRPLCHPRYLLLCRLLCLHRSPHSRHEARMLFGSFFDFTWNADMPVSFWVEATFLHDQSESLRRSLPSPFPQATHECQGPPQRLLFLQHLSQAASMIEQKYVCMQWNLCLKQSASPIKTGPRTLKYIEMFPDLWCVSFWL